MSDASVVVLPGDGIGPEIWAAAQPVLDAASAKIGKSVKWIPAAAGQQGIEEFGTPLPRETLELIEEHSLALKGPLTTPVGSGFRSVNVSMRLHFDLYANIRPVRCLPRVPTPVHNPERVDIVLFRENTEDVYAGMELEANTPEVLELANFCREKFGWAIKPDAGIGLKPISETASKRLVRAAMRYAERTNRDSVTLVHKGNIMKFTEGAFRNWGYEVAREEFSHVAYMESDPDGSGSIAVRDVIADAFLQEILIHPERFSVVATTNLNGDYASDALAAQVGGVGVAPGANVNEEDGRGVFEAVHGTAPSIAGQNIANPIALVLSGAMLFDFLGWGAAGTLVRTAVENVVGSGIGTPDLDIRDKRGTREFGETLVEAVETGLPPLES